MKDTVKSIEDSVKWLQSVADWTAKATERPSICRRIIGIFRGPAFSKIVEGAIQCIETGVVEHHLEEQLRVSELVYVLNLIQMFRERVSQGPKGDIMDQEGDLAALHDMSHPEEYDWQTRLQAIAKQLLRKYVEIFRQGTVEVENLAMTCEKIYSNGRFNNELVGEIRARMDKFDPLHCSICQRVALT